jgi:hypothetical protein
VPWRSGDREFTRSRWAIDGAGACDGVVEEETTDNCEVSCWDIVTFSDVRIASGPWNLLISGRTEMGITDWLFGIRRK